MFTALYVSEFDEICDSLSAADEPALAAEIARAFATGLWGVVPGDRVEIVSGSYDEFVAGLEVSGDFPIFPRK